MKMEKRYCPDCYRNLKISKRFAETYVCRYCGERFSLNVTLSRYDLEKIINNRNENPFRKKPHEKRYG